MTLLQCLGSLAPRLAAPLPRPWAVHPQPRPQGHRLTPAPRESPAGNPRHTTQEPRAPRKPRPECRSPSLIHAPPCVRPRRGAMAQATSRRRSAEGGAGSRGRRGEREPLLSPREARCSMLTRQGTATPLRREAPGLTNCWPRARCLRGAVPTGAAALVVRVGSLLLGDTEATQPVPRGWASLTCLHASVTSPLHDAPCGACGFWLDFHVGFGHLGQPVS